ncbi:hypothetical protein AB0L74_06855 [Streptomyces sp. NPDC052020]|uniref:hypothetical protein n=1 Tax=Streptomyces sp. NPDC052020 TaxID=3155677 RepID=UPI003449F6FD
MWAEDRSGTRVAELLHAVTTGLPDRLAEPVRAHPELTGGTLVRDAGLEELRAAAGTPLEAALRVRQRLLDDLCGGRVDPGTAIGRYAAPLGAFAGGLRARLYAMYHEVRAAAGTDVIPLAREALGLAGRLGEEEVETELAARLGERLVAAARTGLDAAGLSEALRVLGLALARLPEGSPQWAEVANNLAAAQHLRDDGDRLERWEAARDLLTRAAGLDRRAHPEHWARIQTNYGLLLAERPGGGAADLTAGIGRVRAGLAERSPERDRVDWAYSLLNLGLLLYRRAGPDDVRQAERCCRDALRHLRPDDDPVLWSQTQCNLADLLLARDPADPRGARDAAAAVLAWDAGHPGLLDTGRVTWLLARATDRLDGPGGPEGVRLRRAALAAVPPRVSPSLHLAIAREVLDALAAAGDWTGAAEAASDMLTAVHALYDAQVTAAGRRSVLAEATGISRWAAFLLARAGHPDRAVVAIERGLACELSVVTGRAAVDLEALERADPALARRYRQARERYRSLAARAPAAPAGGPAAGTVLAAGAQAAAERAVRTVIGEIRAIPGFADFLRTTELADIVRSTGGTPLVYLVNAPWGSCVLTIPRGADARAAGGGTPGAAPRAPAVRACFVPEVSSASIVRLLTLDPAGGGPGLLLVQQADAARRRRLLPAALDRLRDLHVNTPASMPASLPTSLPSCSPPRRSVVRNRDGLAVPAPAPVMRFIRSPLTGRSPVHESGHLRPPRQDTAHRGNGHPRPLERGSNARRQTLMRRARSRERLVIIGGT